MCCCGYRRVRRDQEPRVYETASLQVGLAIATNQEQPQRPASYASFVGIDSDVGRLDRTKDL
jgi:hypothetical protein